VILSQDESYGVAGFTLGGGSGWLEWKLGLACDTLIAVELGTAAADQVRASESENPDLFCRRWRA
jgi:FAD/FMN-containing dehydrogenase